MIAPVAAVEPRIAAPATAPPATLLAATDQIVVGLARGVDQKPAGWKDKLHHPFESPFIDDAPAVAAARYASWLQAQPVFMMWVREQLAGKKLVGNTGAGDAASGVMATALGTASASAADCGDVKASADCSVAKASEHDAAHAAMLTTLVAATALEAAVCELPEIAMGELRIGNLKALQQKQKKSAAAAAPGGRRDPSTMPCRDFAKGKCTRGDACRFSHAYSGPDGFAVVCVDRSTALGNPFKMGADGHDEAKRDAVCNAYADLLAAATAALPPQQKAAGAAASHPAEGAAGVSAAGAGAAAAAGPAALWSGVDPVAVGAVHGVVVDSRFADAAKCEAARMNALRQLKARLARGESLRLVCWCAPRRCHAEEIAKWLIN